MKRIFTVFFLIGFFNAFSQNIDNGLILYFPFNGNANDVTGNGLHGTVDGATLTTDKDGNSNSAYYFGDMGNSINVPENALLRPGNVSISVWFNAEEENYIYPLVYKGTVQDTTSYQYSIVGYEDDVQQTGFVSLIRTGAQCDAWADPFNSQDNEPYLDELTGFNYNSWHHAVITYNGTELKLYMDNQLINTSVKSAGTITDCAGGGLNIGTCPVIFEIQDNGPELIQWYFTGKIDEVRVYDRAITDAEIGQLFALATGNKPASMDQFFSVSPNPSTTGNFSVETTMDLKNPELSLIDFTGRPVEVNITPMGDNFKIDLSNHPKGIYYLLIKDGDKVSNQKLVHQ